MIDKSALLSLVRTMERAAEEALQCDAAFQEALQALKWEIDRDPAVRSAVGRLQTNGDRIFNSFVPQIKIRVRTDEGVFPAPEPSAVPSSRATEPQLTQELRNATGAVLTRSGHRAELNNIVNEAVAASERFEGIAAELERAGHQVIISLDFSTYSQVRRSANAIAKTRPPAVCEEPPLFSPQDLKFLKAFKIKGTD